MILRLLLFSFLVFGASVHPVAAEVGIEAVFNEAEDYFIGRNGKEKNDAEALKRYQKVVSAHLSEDQKEMRARAEFVIGLAHYMGLGGYKEDYRAAFPYIKSSAEGGYPKALWMMGMMLGRGDGTPKNLEESLKWTIRCAETGDENCMNSVAAAYEFGDGTAKNMPEALKWYERAAEAGHERAIASAGRILSDARYGAGVDIKRANVYLEQAAESGDEESIYQLALNLSRGEDVPRDELRSQKLYCQAADAKKDFFVKSLVQEKCGLGYFIGIGGPRDFKNALKYLELAANAKENPSHRALVHIGDIYAMGYDGIPKDSRKAVAYYNRALREDIAQAKSRLAMAYLKGEGVPKDENYAYRLAKEAADQGDKDGIFYVAKFYQTGTGVKQNFKESARWAERAADAGHQRAAQWLGSFYALDDQGFQDYEKSFYWFRRASEYDLPMSLYMTGSYLAKGLGTERNETQAIEYFRRAAEAGDDSAIRELEKRGLPIPQVISKKSEEPVTSMLEPDNWGDL